MPVMHPLEIIITYNIKVIKSILWREIKYEKRLQYNKSIISYTQYRRTYECSIFMGVTVLHTTSLEFWENASSIRSVELIRNHYLSLFGLYNVQFKNIKQSLTIFHFIQNGVIAF